MADDSFPHVDHPPDPPPLIVADVDRARFILSQPDRSVARAAWIQMPSRKSVGKDLERRSEARAGSWHQHDLVSSLRLRSAIPGSMKGEQRCTAELGRQRIPSQEEQSIRPPMTGKSDDRLFRRG